MATPRQSDDGAVERYYLDFDVESQVLRFRKPNGEIIQGFEFNLTQLARHHRPILELAKKERLIDFIPDGRLHDFQLNLSRQQGFYVEACNRPIEARRDCYIFVDLGNGKRGAILIRLPVPPGADVLRLIPYIDEDQMLRVWNLGTEADLEMRLGVYTRSADEVRRMSPELFAYAQSLGYWKVA